MKKTVLLFLLLAVFAVFGTVLAEEYSCGAAVTCTLAEDGVFTVNGTGPMEDFRYTGDVLWKDVRDNIRRIVVEEGVTKVGSNAFYFSRNLTEVSLPESLTAIGSGAFQSCSALISINLPDGIVSIGSYAFQNCTKLPSIHIPNSLETIDNYTFYGCEKLVSVTLPETLKYIGDSAFYGCDSLTDVVIPASLTYISDKKAFMDCRALQNINAAADNPNYTSVDGVLFNKDQSRLLYYPSGKTNAAYTVPDTVTMVNDYAFYNGKNLMSLTVPGSVKTVGASAFAGCDKLTDITLSEGIQSIGDSAFSMCSKLTEITFPASLISLGKYPFEGCKMLMAFRVAEGSAYFTSVNGVLFSADKTTLAAYPRGLNNVTYEIPEGVQTIREHAFANNSVLINITLPSSLISIERAAFYNCGLLLSITFPEGLRSIDESAFNECDALKTVTIPESVISVGDNAFAWCENLISVTILNPATTLDKWGVFDYSNEALTIYGWPGSTAQEHAEKEEIPFVELEQPTETPSPVEKQTPDIFKRHEDDVHDHADDPWTCANCGAELDGGNFCSDCGTPRPQKQICGNCGFIVPEGKSMKFCPECGTKFDTLPTRIGGELEKMDNETLLTIRGLIDAELERR